MAYSYKITKEMYKVLPEHYIKRCLDFNTYEPLPVHWEKEPGEHKLDEHGQVVRVQNVPIRVIYPKQANEGLWGGEGIVKGYRKKGPKKRKIPKLWMPQLWKRVLYSEILDECLSLTVTPRVLMLIDDHYGLDFYILKTPECDLNSQLAMSLKRRMLLALATRSLYPHDPVKREKVYDKYKDFALPEEEAEWVGLPLNEALEKGHAIYDKLNPTIPLKESLAYKFIEHLKDKKIKENEDAGAKGWKSLFNPFENKSTKDA